MSIRVVNLRDYAKVEGEVLIKVDRSSVLGNPFKMRFDDDLARNEVCDLYEKYFNAEVKKPGAFRNEVIRIFRLARDGQDIALGCWCAPKRCHAEYIKAFIEKYLPSPEESKGSASLICEDLKHPTEPFIHYEFRNYSNCRDQVCITYFKGVDNFDCNGPLEYIKKKRVMPLADARKFYKECLNAGFINPWKASK